MRCVRVSAGLRPRLVKILVVRLTGLRTPVDDEDQSMPCEVIVLCERFIRGILLRKIVTP